MSSPCIGFTYTGDPEGRVRILENWKEVELYISGFDIHEHGYRTFRKDRVIAYLDATEALLKYPRTPPPPRLPKPPKDSCPHILFTGFAAAHRAGLEQQAEAAGLSVKKKVTLECRYLIVGKTPGPTKLAEAHERGACILTEDQFQVMLTTGELPEAGA